MTDNKQGVYYAIRKMHRTIDVNGIKRSIDGIYGFIPVFEKKEEALAMVNGDESQVMKIEKTAN